MSQRPKHLPESLYLAGKGFAIGVATGLSGVLVHPIRGAHFRRISEIADSISAQSCCSDGISPKFCV